MDEDELHALSAKMNALTDRIGRDNGYELDETGQWRTPAKAIGAGTGPHESGYVPGAFITAIRDARSRDAEDQAKGKAALSDLSTYISEDVIRNVYNSAATLYGPGAKSTLGTTDATGGWVIPNALVDGFTKAAGYVNPYRSLLTVRTGVRSAAVDLPFRSGRPNRAVIAAFGATKENVDLVYNGYTATMYTLARIHDIGNQFLRQSAGTAEQDVTEELATAIALGEAYYTTVGSGSSEPYGLITALNAGPAAYRSTFTPSATTLAGSILSSIATAAGALAGRGRRATAAVMSSTAYWTMVGQGTDTAGFFLSGINGSVMPGVANGTLVTPFGVPVIPDDQFPTDDLVVGEWPALKMYLGDGYRVDSSDQAGTRWDANLTGFRGEEEFGLDARPSVYAGAFQIIQDILP